MTKVAIHQPEYFPWLGLLDKIARSDIFVILDHVQFDRSSLQQRAKIFGSGGAQWMSIPFVHKFPQTISEVGIADDRWRKKHRKSLQAVYGRALAYESAAPLLDQFFDKKYSNLCEVSVASMRMLMTAFDINGDIKVIRSSDLNITSDKGEMVLDICKALKGTKYLSGRSGADYLDQEMFGNNGVSIEVQEFEVPKYERNKPMDEESAYGLSALDAWMFMGENAKNLIHKKNIQGRAES